MSQYRAGKVYLKAITPENNATIALEVAKLTRSNADLRLQVKKLTEYLDTYKNSSESTKTLYDNFTKEQEELGVINGALPRNGQGVTVTVEGKMSSPQIIDLINAIKNIGSDKVAINNERVMINSDLSQFSGKDHYDILILGNGKLLKSAMERRGGIVEQISTKDLKISVIESDNLTIPSGNLMNFKYAKLVNN
jgi:uncharacterized protein YlxW (UPF0749 family)